MVQFTHLRGSLQDCLPLPASLPGVSSQLAAAPRRDARRRARRHTHGEGREGNGSPPPSPTEAGGRGLAVRNRRTQAGSGAPARFFPKMTPVTRQEVLGLYRKIFRIAKKWQSASGQIEETIKEKEYIKNEAKTLFKKNKNVMDPKLIKQCIEECEARIEIGLHYNIPYPRPIHLPPMGLAHKQGRMLRHQEKLRKISKPIYLKSHDEVS